MKQQVSSTIKKDIKPSVKQSISQNSELNKPPLKPQDKQQKIQVNVAKLKQDSSSLQQDQNNDQNQINNVKKQQPSTLSLKKLQNSSVLLDKTSARQSETSIDKNRNNISIMSATSQLSMLKKSSSSVYGSEAGQKPVTKNPWAPIKSQDDKKNQPTLGLKSSRSNRNLGSVSPSNSRKQVKGIMNSTSSKKSLQKQKSTTQLKESSQSTNFQQQKKLVNSGINFGTFHQISQKYIENQYKEVAPKNKDDDHELYTLKKISHLSNQLQLIQKQKILKEMNMLNLQYELFLGENSLKDKIKLVTELNEFLQQSLSLSDKYDDIMKEKKETGNYVRINFEGRSIFLDIIKSQVNNSSTLENNKEQNEKLPQNNIKQKRDEKCLWNAPQNIFPIDNQIEQTEKIENLIEYLDNLISDLNQQYKKLLENQKYL